MISIGSLQAGKLIKTMWPEQCDMLEDVKDKITEVPWSPILYNHNTRKEFNFNRSRLVVLDIDDGLPLDEAIGAVRDYRHIIGTTKSHQIEKNGKPACDRYRVILVAKDWCLNLAQYKRSMKFFADQFGGDKSCTDGARYFWPCEDIVSFNEYGEMVNWSDPPIERYRRKIQRVDRQCPDFIADLLNMKYLGKSGSRHHTLFFCCAELGRCGFGVDEMQEKVLLSPLADELISEHNNIEEVIRHVRNGFAQGWKDRKEG